MNIEKIEFQDLPSNAINKFIDLYMILLINFRNPEITKNEYFYVIKFSKPNSTNFYNLIFTTLDNGIGIDLGELKELTINYHFIQKHNLYEWKYEEEIYSFLNLKYDKKRIENLKEQFYNEHRGSLSAKNLGLI